MTEIVNKGYIKLKPKLEAMSTTPTLECTNSKGYNVSRYNEGKWFCKICRIGKIYIGHPCWVY